MSAVVKVWSRLAAAVTGAVLALVVPMHAWAAANSFDGVAIEAAKARRRGGLGFLGLAGGVCCLFVVAAVVLVIVVVARRRKK